MRVEFFGDEIDRISEIDVLTGEIKCQRSHISIFPASHYVVPAEQIQRAAVAIEEELKERVEYFKSEDKLLEAQRISERTNFDIEMMKENRILFRNRKLFQTSVRIKARTAAIHTAGLFWR